MSWFNDLLRTPPAKSPAARPAGQPAEASRAPAVQPDVARAALAAATGEEQRKACADELGCALASVSRAPLPDDGPGVWAAAVSHVGDKSLALQWLANLNGDQWLGEVAVRGRFAEVRLAAVQRIADHDVLEQISRLSRGKDKGVFRHCSDVLRERRQSAERAQRITRLAAASRELLARSPLSVSGLLDLQSELQALEDGGEALAECRMLLDQASAHLKQESEARRELHTWRDEAAELAARVGTAAADAAWPDAEQLERWRDDFSRLTQAHNELAPWLADGVAAQALGASLRQIESRLTALEADSARIRACEQFLGALTEGSIDPATTTAWKELSKPDQPEWRERLQTRWHALQATAEVAPPAPVVEPRPEPRPEPQIDVAAVRTLLERMEQALEEGHLAEAESAAKSIKAAVGGAALRGSLAGRVQRAQTRLGELSGWAKWGAQQHREHLISSAEELLAGNHGVDYLAHAIPGLREEWKRLNGQAPSPQADWERFDAALAKAYRPVAAQRAEEAARRAQARSDKEKLCTEWEAFVAAIDWDHADHAAVAARREEMTRQWRASARAGFRDERALQKRFDAMLADIDQRLAAARTAEIGRREQLIAAAQALREAPDLREAMAQAKTLQESWRNGTGPVRLPRGEDQKLWRRFRAACDAVFARRDAQRVEQAAQREKLAQARVAVLDALAAALDGTEPGQIKRALAQFRADWADAKTAAPGAYPDPLEQRARQLQQQAQRRIETLHRDSYRTRLEALAQQAAPADALDADALAAGREAREGLLIDLEIALDLPTPEQFAAARRRRQLERLQNRFRGAKPQQPPQAEQMLARWYATACGPDEAMDQRIAAVVRKLLEQERAGAGR